MKNLSKSLFLFFTIGMLFFSSNSFSQDASLVPPSGSGEGCSFTILDMDFPCTKIWCKSTMSYQACGIGDANSQTCSTSKGC